MSGTARAGEGEAAPPLVLVLSTAPDEGTALALARALVEARLAACVNVLPGATSVYRWEGAVQAEREWLLVMKARRDAVPALAERVAALHPYDVPEVVAAPVLGGLDAYLRWVAAETAPPPGDPGRGDALPAPHPEG